MASILWWILVGLVAGLLARWIFPGRYEPTGFVLTVLLGLQHAPEVLTPIRTTRGSAVAGSGFWWAGRDLNPQGPLSPAEFKSAAFAVSPPARSLRAQRRSPIIGHAVRV